MSVGCIKSKGGVIRGAVAQSLERVTIRQEVMRSILAPGAPLPIGWVGVSIMWRAETEVMVSLLCVCDSPHKWQKSVLPPVREIA